MMQRKAQLVKRAALVADLQPDEERQKELQLEEEGSRTVSSSNLEPFLQCFPFLPFFSSSFFPSFFFFFFSVLP